MALNSVQSANVPSSNYSLALDAEYRCVTSSQLYPRGNATTGNSVSAVLPQVSLPLLRIPRYSRHPHYHADP